jgi:uncharacterized protein YbbK (DUF523 family)
MIDGMSGEAGESATDVRGLLALSRGPSCGVCAVYVKAHTGGRLELQTAGQVPVDRKVSALQIAVALLLINACIADYLQSMQ